MKVQNYETISQTPVGMEGSQGCTVRQLVGSAEQAPNFTMRQFEVAIGGHTPKHFHPYEHEVFVLAGSGEIHEGNVVHGLKAGDVVYVAPNEVHQFRNTGEAPLKFLCLVPNSAYDPNVKVTPECSPDE